MKTNHPQMLYNADNTPEVREQEPSSAQNKSPYLKAILSGSTNLVVAGNNLPEVNPDRVAALRYIKECAFLKKIYM